MMNKKENNKEIFSTDFNMTLEEYQKLVRITPSFYWVNVLKTSMVEIIIILIMSVIYKLDITTTIIISMITICTLMLLYKIKIDWLAKRYYDSYKAKQMLTSSKVTFFDTYLTKTNANIQVKIDYQQIDKIIETESNLYIYNKNTVCIVNKKQCQEPELDFIRNINSEKYKIKINPKKKSFSNKNINPIFLKILFWLTILSFFGAVLTIRTIAKDMSSSLITEKMWIFWLWLPLPILSIIIGHRYKNKKAKNSGYVISILLIVVGSFCVVMPVRRVTYNKIKPYEEILKVDIPKDGDYIQKRYATYFDLDKKNVIVTEAFFHDSVELTEFEQNIVKGQNWINFKEVSLNLKSLIPYQMLQRECKECYITIYNENTQKYNDIEEIKTGHKMHVALYNLEKNEMEINTYELE